MLLSFISLGMSESVDTSALCCPSLCLFAPCSQRNVSASDELVKEREFQVTRHEPPARECLPGVSAAANQEWPVQLGPCRQLAWMQSVKGQSLKRCRTRPFPLHLLKGEAALFRLHPHHAASAAPHSVHRLNEPLLPRRRLCVEAPTW